MTYGSLCNTHVRSCDSRHDSSELMIPAVETVNTSLALSRKAQQALLAPAIRSSTAGSSAGLEKYARTPEALRLL